MRVKYTESIGVTELPDDWKKIENRIEVSK